MEATTNLTAQRGALLFLAFTLASFICANSASAFVFPCDTPHFEKGYCLPLDACPHLKSSFSSSKSEVREYIESAICLNKPGYNISVCCGRPENYPFLNLTSEKNDVPLVRSTEPTSTSSEAPTKIYHTSTVTESIDQSASNKARRENVAKTLLLPTRQCGMQHTDDRYSMANGTELDEFPWLVQLKTSEIDYDREFEDRCNGVLINNRYVLTNTYCGQEAIKVVLGQYNTNEKFTCHDVESGDCTEPKVELTIESKTNMGKPHYGSYNLVLLRLSKKVGFSDYIRPICLPVAGSKRPINLHNFTLSGWGASGPGGIIKKRLIYDLIDSEQCYQQYQGMEQGVKLAGFSHACLTSSSENEINAACDGEQGSPLMYKHKQNWYADGILIEVLNFKCHNIQPVSAIFITQDIMNWILDTIKA